MQDPAQIEALPMVVADTISGLDLLINNAGILTDHETIANVRASDLQAHFMVNTIAPVLLVQALLPLLHQGQRPTIVNISSSFASIGRKSAAMPLRYSYAMSKAALNMFSKTLAGELAVQGIIVAAIHPGWTRTRIGGNEAQFQPAESATAVLATIDQLSMEQTGRFLTWDGRELAW
ncbi:SDR family NAD(P)-dependent oxidoreductase [Candidatus Gracilibacteria bacterium]|nr:SDR family NAD(P)-dependent oxidoreductase [Candidatus Gracilibacteria bacterium]